MTKKIVWTAEEIVKKHFEVNIPIRGISEYVNKTKFIDKDKKFLDADEVERIIRDWYDNEENDEPINIHKLLKKLGFKEVKE